MKKYIFGFLLFSSLFSNAQLFDYLPDTASIARPLKGFANFDLGYFVQTNSLDKGFLETMIEGGYLDDNFKKTTLAAVEHRMRLGAMVNISYNRGAKINDKFGAFIAVQNKTFFNTTLSSDLLRLIFYGNKAFDGRTANMNGFSINAMNYLKAGGGVYTSLLTKNKEGRFGIGAYYVLGYHHTSFTAKTFELTTGDNGFYIDMKADMDLKTTIPDSGAFKLPAGKGFCADLFYETFFTVDKGKGMFQIGVYDIGTIKWGDNSTTYKVDTTFHYQGVEVENIFKIGSSSFNGASSDSLINKIFDKKSGSYSTILPAELRASVYLPIHSKVYLSTTVRYFYNSNFKTQFIAGVNYKALKWLMVDAGAGFGGYGSSTVSLGVTASIKQKTFFRIRATNLEGYFAKTAQAQGATFSIARLIR
ncbi:MAG: hypothetical protein J0M08_13600 [Bacteroidetes bacterium]|nr:hypothetical protein [Bacteroidota bacterium]